MISRDLRRSGIGRRPHPAPQTLSVSTPDASARDPWEDHDPWMSDDDSSDDDDCRTSKHGTLSK